jgi:hypothetical protein
MPEDGPPTSRRAPTAWWASVSPDQNISTKNAEQLPDTNPLKNTTPGSPRDPQKNDFAGHHFAIPALSMTPLRG